MARKKIPIEDYVEKNFWLIKMYFDRALKNKKMFFGVAAEEEFEKISLAANNKKHGIDRLSAWIKRYPEPQQWETCKTAVRQKKLLESKKYRLIRVPRDLWWEIDLYAGNVGMTKIEALRRAITIAKNMLAANRNKK